MCTRTVKAGQLGKLSYHYFSFIHVGSEFVVDYIGIYERDFRHRKRVKNNEEEYVVGSIDVLPNPRFEKKLPP